MESSSGDFDLNQPEDLTVAGEESALTTAGLGEQLSCKENLRQPYSERYSQEVFLTLHAQVDDREDRLALEMAGGFGNYDRAHRTREIALELNVSRVTVGRRLRTIFKTGQSLPRNKLLTRFTTEEFDNLSKLADNPEDKQALARLAKGDYLREVIQDHQISLGGLSRRMKAAIETDRSRARVAEPYHRRSRQELFELYRQLDDIDDRGALAMLGGFAGYIRRYGTREAAEALDISFKHLGRRMKIASETGQSAPRRRISAETTEDRPLAYGLINKPEQTRLSLDYGLQPRQIKRLGLILPTLDRIQYEVVASLYGLAGRPAIAQLSPQAQIAHVRNRLEGRNIPVFDDLIMQVRNNIRRHIISRN